MKKIKVLLLAVFLLCIALNSDCQNTIKPDISNSERFTVVNREVTVSDKGGKTVVHLSAKPDDGVAWINNLQFGKGIIEFDVKGKNVMQQSFVGIAFHGKNDSTFDAVYFRPFNFQSPDTARKAHSVQYMSMPQYDWFFLRQKYPGRYENKLTSAIDPESWFHAKIVVGDNISVYVNNDQQPSLVVKPLNDRTTGSIGFWVGNGSDGDFTNLRVSHP